MEQTFLIQYEKCYITIDKSTIHQINSIKKFYVPSVDTFDKERSDAHLDVAVYPFVAFPLILKDICLPSDMVDKLQTIDIKERTTKTMTGVLKEILRMSLVIIVAKRDIMQLIVQKEINNKLIWQLVMIKKRSTYVWRK